ncbi:hypothetical protein GCM10010112_92930 [Actinoplanes lobatus]|uniref:Uncharacterized protein n=1 Tax=Actinoplanes lobatus TaxID=113568 RepID=A0A7W7HR05_9ACTN|nr:hypothetical protein [Actinoplanes lobatus]MBB4755121.1 hypothetical protein [Actinoplanes lobatus]GGN99270.1 hypothetical protein GCM10010112_92930 [Actinoplanes lobatus]GIE40564.1 hypothetical protein Alo02nite_34620 [Actinoplanes lobatus]
MALNAVGDNGGMHPGTWWKTIDPGLLERLDELLCKGRLIPAVKLLRDEGGQQPQPGLYEAQDLLIERRAELDRQGLLPPTPPPTTAQLIEKVEAATAPVLAVEAFWDGDTEGWFVVLVAIVRRPGGRHDCFDEVLLTVLQFGGDLRLFTGQVPPWPEAQQAIEQGRAVAQHVGVPFHFASPEEPNDDLPRWWDSQLN